MSWLKVRNRSALVRMSGVLFLVFAATGATAPLLANYMRLLGADTAQIGVLLATYQAAALASQYLWGQVSDRLGRRAPLVMVGTAGLSLAYLAWAGAGWYGWLLPVRVLEGLAFAAYSTSALALVGDMLEGEAARGRLMGSYRMVGSLAFAAAALGGGLLADTLGLRAPVLLAATCFGLAFLLASGVREAPRAPDAGPGTKDEGDAPSSFVLRPSSARSALLPFLTVVFAWFFGMGSVVALWPVHMQGLGYSQATISGLWALAALGEVPCLLLAGTLADRFGGMRVIVCGLAGMACVYLAYTATAALPLLVAVQLLRSLAYASYEAPALLLATQLGVRAHRGRTVGLYQTVSSAAGIAGAVAGGALAQLIGLPQMFQLVALLMLGAVAVVVAASQGGAKADRRNEAQV